MTPQTASLIGSVDWSASLTGRRKLTEAAAWMLSAIAVLGSVAGALALARWLDIAAGQQVGMDNAMLIDLPPPPPAATAAVESAPDAPQLEVPDAVEPADMPDTSPDRPATLTSPHSLQEPEELQPAQAPDAPIVSDLPLPPPPEAAAKPESKSEARPKPPAQPEKSVASIKTVARSDLTGEGEAAVSRGRAVDLKASWGATIRKRVERRKTYPSAAGQASGTSTLRLVVTRGGRLTSLSIAKTSGNAVLDEAALRAVRSAGSFPAAPSELQDATYVFTLPISFSR